LHADCTKPIAKHDHQSFRGNILANAPCCLKVLTVQASYNECTVSKLGFMDVNHLLTLSTK
jgi:hypothetical protein